MPIILGPCFILASSLRASSSLRYITVSSSKYLRMFEVLTTRRYFGWLRFKLTIFRLEQVVSPNSWFGLQKAATLVVPGTELTPGLAHPRGKQTTTSDCQQDHSFLSRCRLLAKA